MKLISFMCMSLISLFSCASSGKADSEDGVITEAMWNRVAVIDYSFGDASVVPEYHRSYEIQVTKTDAHIRIHSYGTVVFEQTYTIKPAQWQKVIDNLKKLNIRHWEVSAEPCDGGQSEYFAFKSAVKTEQPIFTGSQDTCGNSNVDVGFEAVSQALNAAFPKPIGELVNATIVQ
ncbi:MAG: hypothetical protein K5778_09325 [Bacteroidaceae bacterium]|nr:hypothetical protein [Bacteroidaceae bacterium]